MAETIINVHEAKTHLSRIIEEVLRGKRVVIGRAGKPLVRLTPFMEKRRALRFGLLKGKGKVPSDFAAPLPDDVLSRFLGGSS
jgi:prevent-host-death family protein